MGSKQTSVRIPRSAHTEATFALALHNVGSLLVVRGHQVKQPLSTNPTTAPVPLKSSGGDSGSFFLAQAKQRQCLFQPFLSSGIEGLANTAVFGKQKPTTSQCCLDFDSSEGRAWAGLVCHLFSQFWGKEKKKGAGCFSLQYHCRERRQGWRSSMAYSM